MLTTKILRRLLWPVIVYKKLFLEKDSYLHSTGWFQSVKKCSPVAEDGEPLPWMNYSFISFLQERLNRSMDVFEYGSGSSTLFMAQRVRKIISVECDKAWLNKVNSNLPDNAQLIYSRVDFDGDYCRSISSINQQFDVVIVDGRDRVNCVKQSADSLSTCGVIILDDAEREDYAEAFEYSRSLGFRSLHFDGLKPTEFKISRTTVFYREHNCLGI